jgi:membrane-associated phospholipid phosphatase
LRGSIISHLNSSAYHLEKIWALTPAVILALALSLIAVTGTSASLFLLLNGATADLPPALLQSLTFLGDTVAALALALLFAYRFPHVLPAMVTTAFFATLYTHTLKPLVNAPRPLAVLGEEHVHLFGKALKTFSFPSGHAVTAFALAGVIVFAVEHRGIRIAVLIGACTVALSRVFVGVHWPIDVAAGALGGWLSAIAGTLLASRWKWGAQPNNQRILVAILMAVSLSLFVYDGGYPLAQPLAWSLAVAALISGGLTLRTLAKHTA